MSLFSGSVADRYIPHVASTLYHMEWVRAEAIRQTKLAICEAVIDDDRGFDYRSNFSPFRVSVTGLWMLSSDFDPVSNSGSEGFCSGWIVRLNATGATHLNREQLFQ
jgi:hypothetical protein